jgi:hypothetical protein
LVGLLRQAAVDAKLALSECRLSEVTQENPVFPCGETGILLIEDCQNTLVRVAASVLAVGLGEVRELVEDEEEGAAPGATDHVVEQRVLVGEADAPTNCSASVRRVA